MPAIRMTDPDRIEEVPQDFFRSQDERLIAAEDVALGLDRVPGGRNARIVQEGISKYEELARNWSIDKVNNTLFQLRLRYKLEAKTETPEGQLLALLTGRPDREMTIEQRIALVNAWFETDYASRPADPEPQQERTVGIIADPHAYLDPRIIQWLVDQDFDYVLVGGDILDVYELRAERYKGTAIDAHMKGRSLVEEMDQVRADFQFLDESTSSRYLTIIGNHDARVVTTFHKAVAGNSALMKRLFVNPVDWLITGLNRFSREEFTYFFRDADGNPLRESFTTPFAMRFGDIFISHLNFTSSNPGESARKLWGWVNDWSDFVSSFDGLNMVVQTHTHKMSVTPIGTGSKFLMEPGIAMSPTGIAYQLVYNPTWKSAPTGGLSLVQYQDEDGNWLTDRSSVQIHIV